MTPSMSPFFLSMSHALDGEDFSSYEDVAKWVDEWKIGKSKKCFPNDIYKLTERWKKVVANDG